MARWRRLGVAGALAFVALAPQAAPLDALLSARPERLGARAHVELGVGRADRRLDFSRPDDDPEIAEAAQNGAYDELQLNAGWQPREGAWLTGGLRTRRLSDGVDRYRYLSWQVSGLLRLNEGEGSMPALAVRLGAWGSGAGRTATRTPVRVPGAVLDSVTITRPRDGQLQLDLVGTWTPAPNLDLSAMLGAGRSRLAYADLAATTTRNGCRYDLAFRGNDIFGTLAGPCDAPGVIEQFYDRSGDYGVDVRRELAWRGSFATGGVNLAWRQGPWGVRAGVAWFRMERDGIDEILAGRGQRGYRSVRLLAVEGTRRLHPNLSALLRLEASNHLFLADLPVAYNSGTAARFGGRFSQVVLGVRAEF